MPLFLNNDDVEKVITMKDTMEALEVLYRELGERITVGAPRSDLHVPTAAAKNAEAPMAHYLKSMSGASPHFGTAALRFSSDIVTWRPAGDGIRREKLPTMPGNRWLGIVMLFSSENGELLAIMNDGVLQRMRVGGANGVATKYLARKDAEFVGQVVGIEIVPVDSYEEAVRGVDIIITATNSRTPFLGKWAVAEGIHLSSMQRDEFDDEALLSCSLLVLHTQLTENNSTSSELAQFEREDFKLRDHPTTRGIDWKSLPTLSDLLCGRIKGREKDSQITGFVNNIGLGAQFAAVGAKVYAAAKAKGLGREVPLDWFTQDVHP